MKEANFLSEILQETPKGVILSVKVLPKAAETQIMGIEGGALKIRLHALPEKGKANKELLRFLSKTLGISSSYLEIVSGETFSKKRVSIQKISLDEIIKKLESFL